MPTPASPSADDIARATLALLNTRAASASICPSEVARRLAPEAWRALMPSVRAVAAAMAAEGQLRITQGDHVIDPAAVAEGTVRGPLRLRRG